MRIPIEDPRYVIVRELFRQAGFTPWQEREPKGARRPNEYFLAFLKRYEPDDYEASEFLMPSPPTDARFPGYKHDAAGLLCIESESTNRTALSAAMAAKAGGVNELIVTSPVRATLETARLARLVFRPITFLDRDEKPISWPGGQRWELTSDLTLPSAIPNPPRKWDEPRPQVARYLRSALQRLLPFDLAHAFEQSGKRGRLVASRHFYQFCTSQNIQMDWIPIQIED